LRKDLTFLPDPQSQTLIIAFVKALYTDDYMNECDEFGFDRVTGAVRDAALLALDNDIVTSADAVPWIFETALETQAYVGQGQYVLSGKREAYTEVEQDVIRANVEKLSAELKNVQAQNVLLQQAIESMGQTVGDGSTSDGAMLEDSSSAFSSEEETQLTAALVLASLSFVMSFVGLILIFSKMNGGGNKNAGSTVQSPQANGDVA
jgi:hypothetical protein